ncbi:MAG: protein kinase, partial [Gemmataceae bacterium]|nr:protein kinase [Gemmataceae bacterium]
MSAQADNHHTDGPRPALEQPGEMSLNGILAAYLQGVDAGENPDRDALLAQYPHLADDLRLFFQMQEQLNRACSPLRLTLADPDTSRPAVAGVDTLPVALSNAHTRTIPIPGSPAAQDYEVLEELGRGGMGVVYKARHAHLKRLVALKTILTGSHATPEERARLRTEAEAIARLQHPNIVQVFEVGESQGRSFLALEYCGGGTLRDRLGG